MKIGKVFTYMSFIHIRAEGNWVKRHTCVIMPDIPGQYDIALGAKRHTYVNLPISVETKYCLVYHLSRMLRKVVLYATEQLVNRHVGHYEAKLSKITPQHYRV